MQNWRENTAVPPVRQLTHLRTFIHKDDTAADRHRSTQNEDTLTSRVALMRGPESLP